MTSGAGLVRPDIGEAEAAAIARACYGLDAVATELGSNQDRNFLLTHADGTRSVLRIDNPAFTELEREAQHAALDTYRAAGMSVPAVLPGLDGKLTQRSGPKQGSGPTRSGGDGYAVRRSEFIAGESMLDAGYLAPIVTEEFGRLAAASVTALASLQHPGLERTHMWVMSRAHDETVKLAPSIADTSLRERVLAAAEFAERALAPLAEALPVQAIHGDLTDDNVMGRRGPDSRLHPHTVLDLGDIAYGWRIAELAVTLSSLLHHEPERPWRVLDAVDAFHRDVPLSLVEARALWPLVVLRASLLVASGHRQLEIDGGNDYARERTAVEQTIFDAATLLPLAEMTELVLARLGFQGVASGPSFKLVAAPGGHASDAAPPLRRLLPTLTGPVTILDVGVESEALDAGKWLDPAVEETLIAEAFAGGAAAVVLPYGVYRLTRTPINDANAAGTWAADTEIYVPGAGTAPGSGATEVTSPVNGTIEAAGPGGVVIESDHGWRLVVGGIDPLCKEGANVRAGDLIGEVRGGAQESVASHRIVIGWRRADAWQHGVTEAAFIAAHRVPAWRRFTHDPAAILGLDRYEQRDDAENELLRRERIFASAQERYYERPMQVERGWQHHLVDTTGRAYVDMVNNVAGLGHGHPGVADAVNRQIRVLNTNSRFLYRELAEYSERLLALLPEGSAGDPQLDTVLLVNSGSEAVDLALRLAQAATGRNTIVALREAYHGWTMASDAVTTSAFDNPHALENRPDWVHIADVPNRFRGTYRGEASDARVGERYAADLAADLVRLAASGRDIAGFICESILGNAGGVLLPEGYLAAVYAHVRAAGGLCIADEVQVGFGRMGSSFWGFEQSGVMPDIVTIAKPMGNGFPIGGVITSKRIADALATQGQFFASTGGNPLSCRVGLAVLDAMRDEGLQDNARIVGAHLLHELERLALKHPIIGHVHGEGLYLGVELVVDRGTFEPATAQAIAICERLRELGVIMLTTSERSNVLKVKPPLCLTIESADFVIAQLDRVLTEGW